MKVVITGTSYGIGHEIALLFLAKGYRVAGLDTLVCSIQSEYYNHYICDVSDISTLPYIPDVNILVNNAGVQGSGSDIDINLKGVMNCTAKYALSNSAIRSVVNISDAVAHMGTSYGEYVASKGGISFYTRWVAKEISKYQATCNCLSFGGVLVSSNSDVMEEQTAWDDIMQMTPLKKWATPQEVAEWVYFISTINTSCSGQDIVIDNLESLNNRYV